MIELKINGMPARVKEGTTVLDAARLLAIDIPTLCHMKDREPETSCMLCVVKNKATGQLIPSCSAKAVEGMELDSECEEVEAALRDILNLLLSEHVGDCEAPCARICPASLDVPLMLREIERGNLESAARIAKRDLVLPATLGYVCPAPCEKGCRRGQLDSALKIRDAHREVSEKFSALNMNFPIAEKKVAVMGSGAAGLASAWKARELGYDCVVYDAAEKAGGDLRMHDALPLRVLDAEIDSLKAVGIEFKLGQAPSLHEIAGAYAGVIFATKDFSNALFSDAFHAEEHKLTVKAIANGKAAMVALDQSLNGESAESPNPFDSKIARPRKSEIRALLKNCSPAEALGDLPAEAARCLHCDCRKPTSCKLRTYAERYGADPREFPADERGPIELIGHGESVIFEPGKCVKCGLCVRITKDAGEELGLAFVGRGFNTRVSVPLYGTLKDGLRKTAAACVEHCPTGALSFVDREEKLL